MTTQYFIQTTNVQICMSRLELMQLHWKGHDLKCSIPNSGGIKVSMMGYNLIMNCLSAPKTYKVVRCL